MFDRAKQSAEARAAGRAGGRAAMPIPHRVGCEVHEPPRAYVRDRSAAVWWWLRQEVRMEMPSPSSFSPRTKNRTAITATLC